MSTLIHGLISLGLESALLAILIGRRLYRRFPAFFSYSLWTVCVIAIRLSLNKYPFAFFLAFWLTEASYLLLALIVMLSILQPFLMEAYRRRPRTRYLLWSVFALLTGSSLLAAIFKPILPTLLGHFASGMYVFVPLICLLEVLIFLPALSSKTRHGFEWTRYEAGILAGFGILAFMNMFARLPALLALFHFRVWPHLEALFRYFPSGAFITSAIAWLIAFWRPEPPREDEPPTPPHKYRELVRLQQEGLAALKELAKHLGFDFENTAGCA